MIGTNFLSLANAFEVLRLSVEIGLLAVALTPVIISGGIDLSVGSLMGLSAVVFGKLWRDGGLPIGVAAALTLVLGALAGSLNGLLDHPRAHPAPDRDARLVLAVPRPGRGADRRRRQLHRLPRARSSSWARAIRWAGFPTQVPIFVVVAAAFWVLLHRTTIGRGLVAIGFSPEGARYAGLPVERLVALVYLLSGLVASLAAIIYVAHLGQAKADAGTGYELAAITAVVLGGTSIFGGRGSVPGTLLGLFAIAVLQNGLRLADLPAELAGVLTGTLLLVAIGLDRTARAGPRRAAMLNSSSEVMTVKNSQVAVICAAILAAALINAASNVCPGPIAQERRSGRDCSRPAIAAAASCNGHGARPITVAMMPKSKGNAYFIACRKGAEEAATELGVKLIWDGPTDPDPAKQNEVDRHLDHPRRRRDRRGRREPRGDLARCCARPASAGIKVLTWDADAEPDARDFFVNQATPEGIGQTLMDNAARVLGGKGEFAIITASLTAANMIEWQKTHRGPPAGEISRRSRWPRCGRATTFRRRRSTRPTRS